MKRLLTLFFCCLAGIASAGTFTANGGSGTSTVGSGGDDYPTLEAAALDFSSFPGGCTGNWTLNITAATVTCPDNIAFGNATNGFTVTVKPAVGVNSTVTFTTSTANTGAWSGNWLIGIPSTNTTIDNLVATNNFVIDGSNNGSNLRNLTIQNVATPTSLETNLIRTLGACQNTTIKNVMLKSNSHASALNFPIEFTGRTTAGGAMLFSNGSRIENCDISCLTGANTQNILYRQNPTAPTSGNAHNNIVITSNNINGIQNLVNLGICANAQVTDNILSCTAVASNRNPIGIQHNKSNHNSNWTVSILRNKFVNWDNAAASTNQGLGPMVELDPDTTTSETGNYMIANNFFAGIKFTNTAVAAQTPGNYRVVTLRCAATSTSANVKLYHNSFNIPNISSIAVPNRHDVYHVVAINTTALANEFWGTFDVKNNIFAVDQNNTVVFFRTSTSIGPGVLTSNYNTFHLANGAKMAAYANTGANTIANYNTLADWQAAGFDTNSRIIDPRVPAASGLGKWVSSTDLHFDGDPSTYYLGTGVGITNDIDMQARSVATPVIGADELAVTAAFTAANDWALFQ